MGEKPAALLTASGAARALPLVEPEIPFTVGMVVLPREPHTPLVDAFLRHVGGLARTSV
jgi:hypothetical protein